MTLIETIEALTGIAETNPLYFINGAIIMVVVLTSVLVLDHFLILLRVGVNRGIR